MLTTSTDLNIIAKQAKKACWTMASIDETLKNKALKQILFSLKDNYNKIIESNNEDLNQAKILVEKGELSKALYKRLALTETKFNEMIKGIEDISELPDPSGKILFEKELDEGLILKKISCPIGVIGVIFESRPDVIVQISSLAIKSGNTVILKGGSEAIHTNIALVNIINNVLKQHKEIPDNVINLIQKREEVKEMLSLDNYIDLIIPRGSNEFVQYIQNNTRIPVLGHADGICHIYIDKDADQNIINKVCIDSKTDYPSACNAVETLLVHKDINASILTSLIDDLKALNVEIRAEKSLIEKLSSSALIKAIEEDWKTEYNDLIISIKEVSSVNDAITHINTYGSGHTDCIITNNIETSELFMNLVDSAGVYCNASTRFADGYRYGFGAEVGISTNKTHARGPVGLEGLMIYKYKLYGNGQIASEYTQGIKTFTHKTIS